MLPAGHLGGVQSACCVCKALAHQCTAAAWLDSYLVLFYAATVGLLWLNDDRATQVRTADPKASPCAGLSGKTCGVSVLSRCAGACSLPSSIRAERAVLARCLCSPLLQQTPTRTLLYLLSHGLLIRGARPNTGALGDMVGCGGGCACWSNRFVFQVAHGSSLHAS